MLRNQLAEIMGIRGLKLSDVHRGTKIARTTLSMIYHNESSSISFEVLDKLLMYLSVEPNDFFEYLPYDVSFDFEFDAPETTEEGGEGIAYILFTNIKGNVQFKKGIKITIKPGPIDWDFITFDYEIIYEDEDINSPLPELTYAQQIFINVQLTRFVNAALRKTVAKLYVEDDNIEIMDNYVESTGFMALRK